ncbi:TIGR03088 family PEP-CTERM/XrtA system glycosyltransferase [Kineobactrum salinum]|uniref:TIGR03088 family PEP-CTERM/XrtA system glycosyltransferase n=2 Tax=Kineobactrum salinum TaxID=2708301 RepID=A0A6C0U628_9GAMM|nr:TIGR03088 family PEP-CTERM/XrtA system glycosyltransferase [Kineobactrum salinum]
MAHTVNADSVPLVVHIIYALGTGGLENGLVNIINRSPPGRYRHAIVCLSHAEDFARRVTANDVEVVELHKRPGHDPGMYWRLWRTLRRLRPAIVHTRNLAALETQALGLLMPGCRRVHGEHGRDVSDLDGSNPKYRWLRRALRPLIHRFIAVSRDLADWLVDSVGIPAPKVTQIYNGVDHQRFTARWQAGTTGSGPATAVPRCWPADVPAGFAAGGDCRVIGSVGRLAAVKDQRQILRALQHIFAAHPEQRAGLRCILVGDGPERRTLETEIEALQLDDCVWLAGDREDIPALLACMDIFLLPSLGEGISNTILEAMAIGLPVVATRVGGNPELVQDGVTGRLVPVADAAALGEATVALLRDPALCEAMGRAAIERVQRDFDWERTVADYLRVYDELLQRPRLQPATGGN